jgi:cytochrome b involved in lipid metabolism
MQVAKLQGIERGISRSSRELTVDKADSLDGTARTVDSLHFLRREPSQKSVDPDAIVIKIRDEVRRLQYLQQELAGGSKSSRTLQTSASSMSLTPEQFEKQQKYARNKKYCAIAVGVLILAGVVAGIVSLVSSLQDKNVSFSKEKGGDVPLTLQEVALHATTDDCWASIHGNVYDLTEWVNDHPGGSIYIQSICGKDGTDLYSAQHPTLWLKVYVAG